MSDQEPSNVTPETRFSLAIIVAMVSAIIAGSVWCTKISLGQEQLRNDVQALKDAVEEGTGDRWSRSDMRNLIYQANREVEIWIKTAEPLISPTEPLPSFSFPTIPPR